MFLGGHVTDTGEDSPAAICDFLYSMLVSDQPIMQAFKLAEEVEFEQELPAEVTKVFDELELLAETAAVRARHPIKRFAAIAGAHTVHNPSFSQLNGTQRIYETIDFGIRKPKLIRERSGWMAYMFKDIREKTSDTTAYSIVRSEPDAGGEAIDYAGAILAGDSEVVDWRDAAQKSKFLNNVQRIAERLT